jgi:hypothetical protein
MKTLRLIHSLIAALLAGCASSGRVAVETGIEWQYKGTTNYEEKSPGGGVSKRYESNIGWIDVYRFSAGRNNWLEGTSDPGFKERFDNVAQGILDAQKQGSYRNVSIEPSTDIVVGGHAFRHFIARFELREKVFESHTFMSAVSGQLLKYRMSFAHPPPATVASVTTAFIEQTVGEYEKPAAVAAAKHGRSVKIEIDTPAAEAEQSAWLAYGLALVAWVDPGHEPRTGARIALGPADKT